MTIAESSLPAVKKGFTQKMLDGIERVGNKIPHPVLLFLYLIGFIIILSHILYLAGVKVTETIAEPAPYAASQIYYEDSTGSDLVVGPSADENHFITHETTISVESLLTTEGVRFMFSSFVRNFQNFGVVAVVFIAMMGAGVAEHAGLMSAMIRKLVKVAPAQWITFIIVLVGALSSVATDAGYLILIPLGAAAFISLRRHPLAGMAAAYAGVSAIFAVNVIITPIDSMITEITNEAIALTAGQPITIVANLFFSIVTTILITIVVTIVTDRIVEPRLGKFVAEKGSEGESEEHHQGELTPAENKGMRYALYSVIGMLAFVLLLTLPAHAPLRDPATGSIVGNTPFMDSLLFIITLFFLIAGIFYGIGAGTLKSSNDVIAGVTKTFAGLAGLVFMLLVISQFIAFFNYTNMPTVLAVAMADLLEQANIGALPLLIGLIVVIVLLDIVIPGVIPKWAIFAPIFIPIFTRLGVAPQTVLAAYRVGDSPFNVITPLMVYLPFVITVAQKYQKKAGLGTIISLMLPYALIVMVVWIFIFVIWFVLGIPLGPGYPVGI